MSENKFEFSYTPLSERERREAERLKKKYEPKKGTENKMERLRALDQKVWRVPMIWSLTFGIVGTLAFGAGMAMVLEWGLYLWGIVLATVGLIPVCLAYPLYKWLYERRAKKYREEILRLSEEILQGELSN